MSQAGQLFRELANSMFPEGQDLVGVFDRQSRSGPVSCFLAVETRTGSVPYTCQRLAETADLAFVASFGISNLIAFNTLISFRIAPGPPIYLLDPSQLLRQVFSRRFWPRRYSVRSWSSPKHR